jgi:hypothetical protein
MLCPLSDSKMTPMVCNHTQPPTIVLASLDQHRSTSASRSTSPSATQETVGTPEVQPLPTIFTASSGQCVFFRQVFGQWQAELQSTPNAYTPRRILPVVSSVGDIGMQLKYLQGQDVWSSRSRIHIMATSHPPHTPCVYLGKSGLLGGRENRQRAPSQTNEEWIPGPTMILSSNTTRTVLFRIPRNYRYKGYRVKDGAVVQHASYTICYAEEYSQEVINNFKYLNDVHALTITLDTNFTNVVILKNVKEGDQQSCDKNSQDLQTSRFTHAALVLYGSTNKNKLGSKKSMLDIQVEILVEKISMPPMNSHSRWTIIIPILISSAAALSYFML